MKILIYMTLGMILIIVLFLADWKLGTKEHRIGVIQEKLFNGDNRSSGYGFVGGKYVYIATGHNDEFHIIVRSAGIYTKIEIDLNEFYNLKVGDTTGYNIYTGRSGIEYIISLK